MEGLVFQDVRGQILNWNPAAERLLGLSAEELAGRSSIDPRWSCVHEDETPWPGESHPAMVAAQTRQPVSNEIMGVDRPDGGRAWLRVNSQPVLDRQGNVTSTLTTFADITVEHELLRDQQFFGFVLRNAVDIVTVIDEQGRLKFVSPSGQTSLAKQFRPGTNLWDGVHPDDISGGRAALLELATSGRTEPFVIRIESRRSGYLSFECSAANLLDEPVVRGIVITAQDITERQEADEERAQQGSHLAELLVRRELSAYIDQALLDADGIEPNVLVCLVGLDRFNAVNLKFGRDVGDRLLTAVEGSVRRIVGSDGYVARVSGDEFIVILAPTPADTQAHTLREAIKSAVLQTSIDDVPLARCGTSVGTAVNRNGDTPASLLQRAHDALYDEKARRRSHRPAHIRIVASPEE
jgi:diguanylate cyclase (GGDEF)-like protein/PAS domain S-box-containing protein